MMIEEQLELPVNDKFSQLSFDPDKHVSGIVQRAATVEKILNERQSVVGLSDQTNKLLKKNVYDNYRQFIDTSKEISYVASEMHQLRDMLSQQEQLLHAMTVLSIVEPKGKLSDAIELNDALDGGEDDAKKSVSFLLEKVEGLARVIDNSTDKAVMRCAEVTQIEKDSSLKVYLCLLTDSLLIADALEQRRGTIQYKLRSAFELDSLAVVDAPKNCIKLLVFPQTLFLQLETSQEKLTWLESIREAKSNKLIRAAVFNSGNNYTSLLNQNDIIDGYDSLPPDWLQELPDELDVLIAERSFEPALQLIQRAQEFWPTASPDCSSIRDLRLKIDDRIDLFVKVLSGDLNTCLQGGPRSAQRAVVLLIALGKTSRACALFLEHRAALLRNSTKSQSHCAEGAMSAYVTRLCSVFFNHITETSRNFQKAFSKVTSCSSAFVIWCRDQMKWFVKLVSNHIFATQAPLNLIAESVAICKHACKQLLDFGLDLRFVLDRLLKDDVDRCICEGRDNVLEAVKHRASEDAWKPQKIDPKWATELNELGVVIDSFVYDENMTYLTSNSVAFSKSFLGLVSDLMRLHTPSHHTLVVTSLCSVVSAHKRHIESALKEKGKLKSDVKFIQRNEFFIMDTVREVAYKKLRTSPEGVAIWEQLQKHFQSGHFV